MELCLYLKWGSLKGWSGVKEGTPVRAALERYFEEPVSTSAMMQRDTDAQRAALLDLIDAVAEAGGEIINDWSGERLSRDEARKYIMEYGR